MKSPVRKLALYLIVIFLGLWVLTPVIYTFIISTAGFHLPTELGLPSEVTFSTYLEVFHDEKVWRCALNSMIIAGIATAISMILSVPSAFSLSRDNSRTSTFLFRMFLFFRLLSWVSLVLPIFLLMSKLGLVDTHLGVGIAHSCWIIPTAIWFMKGFFDMIPSEYDESAAVDGASTFQTFKEVVLPLATPGLIAVTLYAYFISFTDYIYSLILTRVNATTLPVLMAGYLSEFNVLWRKIAAISIISTIPLIVLVAVMLKYMKGGMWGGGLKR